MRKMMLYLAALATIACVRTATNEATGDVDLDVESPTKQGEDWGGQIRGQGMYPGITGHGRALVMDGRTEVTVNFEGLPPSGPFPWHVHEGACGSGGGIVGNATAYPPLMPGADGRAATNANLTVALDEAKDYHINVHESPTNLGNIIACGDLDD